MRFTRSPKKSNELFSSFYSFRLTPSFAKATVSGQIGKQRRKHQARFDLENNWSSEVQPSAIDEAHDMMMLSMAVTVFSAQ